MSAKNKMNTTNEVPELKSVIWKFLVQKVGFKKALAIFFCVTLIIVGVEFIPKLIISVSDLSDSFKSNFPKTPKFKPSDFTIGVYVTTNNKFDSLLIRKLTVKFYGQSNVYFYPITSFPKDFTSQIINNPKEAERKILDWISSTGASGALWGTEEIINLDSTYLLNWSHPEVSDFVQDNSSNLIDQSTTRFPALTNEQTSLLLGVYIKSLLKQYATELDKSSFKVQTISDDEKSELKTIYNTICFNTTNTNNCYFLNKIKLEMFLIDTYTLGYFKEEERYKFAKDDSMRQQILKWQKFEELYDVTKNIIESPIAPKTLEEFEHYNKTLSFLKQLSSSVFDPEEYIDLATKWTELSFHNFGLVVEREYPYLKDYINMMNAEIKILDYLYKIHGTERNEKDRWPLNALHTEIANYEISISQLNKSDKINDYQRAVISNRAGVFRSAEAKILKLLNKSFTYSVKKAEAHYKYAIKKLQWFEHRTPRYLATIKLNWANCILTDSLSDVDLNILREAKKEIADAMNIAIEQQSNSLEKYALEVSSVVNSKLAILSKNPALHCLAVKNWSDAQRVSPNISISLEEDSTLDHILISFYNNTTKEKFEKCMKENEFDVNAIYTNLKARLNKR